MSVIDLDAPPFPHDQLSAHCVIVASLVVLVWIEVGVVASLDPHVEASIVSPAASHQIFCCQVLLCFPFVHVKHEEEQLLGHLRDNREIDHLVSRTDRGSIRVFLSLFRREVVVDFGNVSIRGEEKFVVDLLRFLCEVYDLFVDLL